MRGVLKNGENKTSGFFIVQKMLTYVWPKGQWNVKIRVVIALSLLLGAKVFHVLFMSLALNLVLNLMMFQALNITIPFLFKEAIDFYNKNTGDRISFSQPMLILSVVGFSLILACLFHPFVIYYIYFSNQ